MGGQYRCLTLALAEPSCRMGQRLRLPMSVTLRMRAAVHGDGRRGTLRDRVPHSRASLARMRTGHRPGTIARVIRGKGYRGYRHRLTSEGGSDDVYPVPSRDPAPDRHRRCVGRDGRRRWRPLPAPPLPRARSIQEPSDSSPIPAVSPSCCVRRPASTRPSCRRCRKEPRRTFSMVRSTPPRAPPGTRSPSAG